MAKYVVITRDVVKEGWRCPADKPFALVNKKTGQLHSCHPTLDAAHEQAKALYAAQTDRPT